MNTPWGKSQHHTQYGEGIVFHTTAGHGGFYVSPTQRKLMPKLLKSFKTFCGKDGWYEEDADWAVVVIAFPDKFDKSMLQSAIKTINWSKDYFGEDVIEYVNSLSLAELPVM